jgi:hypothetical protein
MRKMNELDFLIGNISRMSWTDKSIEPMIPAAAKYNKFRVNDNVVYTAERIRI